jgi:hypothetical protein
MYVHSHRGSTHILGVHCKYRYGESACESETPFEHEEQINIIVFVFVPWYGLLRLMTWGPNIDILVHGSRPMISL